eukprot:gnl/TRDRNA2_/TRDRNA2_193512_c0_seq1.p1 gnl/TRDRNA2_/TRDRNA2_193512_c0~~gnl/TRDRNA2_/TRDRNA2_193512_c0_seq1.p1  ORF type:complete len:193 (+),score=37.36 gnl/TRDRNA2_/TRDRNA2_193512_c0_seq1:52-579(+)
MAPHGRSPPTRRGGSRSRSRSPKQTEKPRLRNGRAADGGPIRLGSTEAPFTSAAATVAKVPWPQRGLRVRIVDEDGEFKASHLKKGIVKHVDTSACTVLVELENKAGTCRAVPQDKLETIVSKGAVGSQVEVVRGKRTGLIAKLLKRDPNANTATVLDGKNELELALDDVCEFVQ